MNVGCLYINVFKLFLFLFSFHLLIWCHIGKLYLFSGYWIMNVIGCFMFVLGDIVDLVINLLFMMIAWASVLMMMLWMLLIVGNILGMIKLIIVFTVRCVFMNLLCFWFMDTFVAVNVTLSYFTVCLYWAATVIAMCMMLMRFSMIMRASMMSSSMFVTVQYLHDIQIAAKSKHWS